jgi:hypothetical protein
MNSNVPMIVVAHAQLYGGRYDGRFTTVAAPTSFVPNEVMVREPAPTTFFSLTTSVTEWRYRLRPSASACSPRRCTTCSSCAAVPLIYDLIL